MTDANNLTPEQKELLTETLKEIDASMSRIIGERDFIKTKKADFLDQVDIPKKVLNRLIKTYHLGNLDEEVNDQNMVAELYELAVSE